LEEVSDPDYIYEWIEKFKTYDEVGLIRKKEEAYLTIRIKLKN
jgi:transposase